MSEIKLNEEGLNITVEGESNDFFCQDIYTKAINVLIENADIHGWEKHTDDFSINEKFTVSILKSLIRSRAVHDDVPDEMSYREVLTYILEGLSNNKELDEVILFGDE